MNPIGPDATEPRHTEPTKTSAAQHLASGTRLGPYEIINVLGAGGMGEVYRARDPRLNRLVAIKVLRREYARDRDRLRRFEQEARAAGALNHPNILTLHDVGDVDTSPFLVTELLEGHTLREVLHHAQRPDDRTRPVSLEIPTALNYAFQIARGLAAAHAAGIVHRDLKPENIFVTRQGQVKILDFGLAKLAPTDPLVDHTATASGVVMGTVGYMAPEQVRSQPVDRRADVFAFGAVLYEMLAGRRAFAGPSASDTLSAILRDEPQPLTEISRTIPSTLDVLVRRCLTKRPEDRFQSAADLVAALEAVEPSPQSLRDSRLAVALASRRWTNTTVIAVGAVGVVALGLVGWFLAGRSVVPPVEAASIVALPAKVYGAEEFHYLTDAIPATLSTHLAQVEGLETKVPPTSLQFEGVKEDLSRIADAYGVTSCVMSSVTVERERLVLDLQLVEPRTRRVRWSKQYAGSRDGYITLVGEAAEGLRLALKPESAAVNATTGLSTKNSEAELALRRGQYYANRFNNRHLPVDFDLAFASFQHALGVDPALADAAAEVAQLHVHRIEAGTPPGEALPEIESWSRRALALDPRNGKAWGALTAAELNQSRTNARKMLEYGLRAATFGPRCAMCQTSLSISITGSYSLGLESERQALRLDPLYLYPKVNIASFLYNLGRTAEGLTLIDEALKTEPDFPYAIWRLTLALADLGRTADAAQNLERLKLYVTQDRLPALPLALAQHAVARERGDSKAADAALAEILTMTAKADTSNFDRYSVLDDVVPFLSRHGKLDAAIEILSESISLEVTPQYDCLLLNRNYEPLRRDPRFQPILAKARVQFEEMRTVLNEARARGEFPTYLEGPLADLIAKLRAVKAN